MPHPIILTQQHRDHLIAHARAEHPRECCGLVVGRRNGDAIRVVKTIRATNITEDDPARAYQIDWETLFQTIRGLRNTAEQLVGFYHSHPTGSSTPSHRDRREAWINHGYLIIARAQDPNPTITAWELQSTCADFDQQQVVVMRS
ncbi:MAG: M67 family metallopeptidase [Phycisphaerae bacterium]